MSNYIRQMVNISFRELYRSKGFERRDIAANLSLSESLIYKWEAGSRSPRAKHMRELADLLDCSADVILMATLPDIEHSESEAVGDQISESQFG